MCFLRHVVKAPGIKCCCWRRFISPICSAIILSIIFGLVRTFMLRSQHSFRRAFWILPFFVMLTFFIITIFILQTNNKSLRCALLVSLLFLVFWKPATCPVVNMLGCCIHGHSSKGRPRPYMPGQPPLALHCRWGKKLEEGTMLWIAAVVGGGLGIVTLAGVMPFLRKRIIVAEAEADHRCAAGLGVLQCMENLNLLCLR